MFPPIAGVIKCFYKILRHGELDEKDFCEVGFNAFKYLRSRGDYNGSESVRLRLQMTLNALKEMEKDIAEIAKVDNSSINLKFVDGTSKLAPVKKITRASAIERAEAFTGLSGLGNKRNYEIEDMISTVFQAFRIKERCPFNGFSFFD